jgi:hypothetical protein
VAQACSPEPLPPTSHPTHPCQHHQPTHPLPPLASQPTLSSPGPTPRACRPIKFEDVLVGVLVKDAAQLQNATFCDACGDPKAPYVARPRPGVTPAQGARARE